MYNLEYWGIAYLGEIKELGIPLDLNEVSEAKLFSEFPENLSDPGTLRKPRQSTISSRNA